jgi:transketolase
MFQPTSYFVTEICPNYSFCYFTPSVESLACGTIMGSPPRTESRASPHISYPSKPNHLPRMSTNDVRKDVLRMCHATKSSHIGSCFSVVEILYSLLFHVMQNDPRTPDDPGRDYLLLSKGHASAALYATLSERGYFPKEKLDEFYVNGGSLPGHLSKGSVKGVEATAGSLGHGLSIGEGIAYGNRLDGRRGRVFVVIGDGECEEGSIWEAAMSASSLSLSNLTVIVDYNNIQAFNRESVISKFDDLVSRWMSFGWETYTVDGHNVDELVRCLSMPQTGPKAVIARTVKGKGVSFMENQLCWHYRSPNDEEFQMALSELNPK